jgi:hypothetical protein
LRTANLSGRYWDRTSDRCRVKAIRRNRATCANI